MYVALGLGFLSKGPIVLVLVALTLVPYLAPSARLRPGLGLLADGWGLLLFLVLALSWPVPVLLDDPNAARVWYLEMARRRAAGSAPSAPRDPGGRLALDDRALDVVATMAVFLPFLPRGGPPGPASGSPGGGRSATW